MRNSGVGVRLFLTFIFYFLFLMYGSPFLSAWGYHADLPLVVVYLFAYTQGVGVGAVMGLLIGLIQDVLNSSYPFHIIQMGVVGILWGLLRGGFGYTSIPSHGLAIIATSLSVNIGYWLIRGGGAQLPDIVRTALITGLLGMVVIIWFRQWMVPRRSASPGDMSLGPKPISSLSR